MPPKKQKGETKQGYVTHTSETPAAKNTRYILRYACFNLFKLLSLLGPAEVQFLTPRDFQGAN